MLTDAKDAALHFHSGDHSYHFGLFRYLYTMQVVKMFCDFCMIEKVKTGRSISEATGKFWGVKFSSSELFPIFNPGVASPLNYFQLLTATS
jgi:hypothetical protein